MGFADSLRVGTVGEYVVYDYFSKLPDVKEVIDVRDDKRFQNWDVDFLVMMCTRQLTWVEVKLDTRAQDTGNFVYEVQSNADYKTQGCFDKTQAEIIAYYVPRSSHLYFMTTRKLRAYVAEVNPKSISMGDNAIGYLLPIADLERYGVIYNMVDVPSILENTHDTD